MEMPKIKQGLLKRKSGVKKFLLIFIFSIIFLVISGAVFIKLNTTAAAQFTDNVLRPLIGDNNVIRLEQIFFNLSDKAQQIQNKAASAPQFVSVSGDTGAILKNQHLTLDKIPVNDKFTPMSDEGVWKNQPLKAFPNKEVMAYTFTRPDTDRQYAVTTMLKIDMSQVRMGSVAGTKYPGGPVGKPGPGKIPTDIVNSGKLLTAFDGGFQYRDGQYGMIVGNTTYLPLKNDLGTLVGYNDGTLEIVNYTGQSLGINTAFIRQNCPILINNGEITPLDQKDKTLWGRTLTSGIYTWRSGIGLDKDNNLIFAVGNNLTPATLAIALKSAGAVNAIQLDINPTWVRFNLFESQGNGKYNSTTLTKELKDGSKQYLNGYEKDFFYLYQK